MAAFCVRADDNGAVEVALVGREGAIGGIVSNGNVPAFANSEVRASGRFLRIKVSALEQTKTGFDRAAALVLALLGLPDRADIPNRGLQRPPHHSATHGQVAACGGEPNATRSRMTQEQLAEMLGVGRTFITRTLRQLRDDGVIKTKRGMFIVENEAALRARSCACTTAIEDHFDAMLHGIYPVK
jgi:hypothetical protein